jgi:hypothetical protein
MRVVCLLACVLFYFGAKGQVRVWYDDQPITPDSSLKKKIDLLEKWLKETTVFIPIDSFYKEGAINPKTPFSKLIGVKDSFNKKWVYFKIDDFVKASVVELESLNDRLQLRFFLNEIDTAKTGDEVDAFQFRKGIDLLTSQNTRINDTLNVQSIINKLLSISSLIFDKSYSDILFEVYIHPEKGYRYRWDHGLVVHESFKRAGGQSMQYRWERCLDCGTDLLSNQSLFSITKTDYIPVASSSRIARLSYDEFEELAYTLIKKYADSIRLKSKSTFTTIVANKNPAKVNLIHAKGFITGSRNYWEKLEIKIDQLSKKDDRTLVIRCSITGFFVRVSTDAVSSSTFDRPLDIEKEFPVECNGKTQEVIDFFKSEIKKLAK